ncbi:hypothetical protein DB44_ES00010 [Candidatus Protochlamydia amoebophila]|uniref:Uncharacterized protein n=1 Tax=Candidatus Protochlamydia amoebophila TaxID=362787 RepID=A0A0C1H853_9BACT|nr:hypothetical protein DB44_ES00010 [Candidatus Protochlamydia amoebophila]
MGELRKARIKFSAKGKVVDSERMGLPIILLFTLKNVKGYLSSEEKKIILKMIQEIKKGVKNERNV